MSLPSLLRFLSLSANSEFWWPCTFALDEQDFGRRVQKGTEYGDMMNILRGGFERNGIIYRCHEVTRIPVVYRCGSPKIISTREPISDVALASRCLRIQLQPTTREDIPRTLPKEFMELAVEIQNKLLMYRFRRISTITETQIEGNRNNWEKRLLAKGVDGHLIECLMPIAVVILPEDEDWFLGVAQAKAREMVRERSESWYGEVVRALLKTYAKLGRGFRAMDISNVMNEDREPTNAVGSRSIGRVITALKIPRRETNKGALVEPDNAQLVRLLRKYGWLMDDDVIEELRALGIIERLDLDGKRDVSDVSDINAREGSDSISGNKIDGHPPLTSQMSQMSRSEEGIEP